MRRSRFARLLAISCVLLTLAGCARAGAVTQTEGTASAGPRPADSPSAPATAQAPSRGRLGSALDALDLLAVKGRAPMTGYDRAAFGQAWLDANRNGCDTRNDMLARDLRHLTYQVNTRGCVVAEGELADPYTARTVHFVKGQGDLVDIDHVVALGNAWVTGASGWPVQKRAAIANDPMNLLAVDASANRQKGDGDAATWLPSNKAYRCAYVARQVSVKAKYALWVTAPERAAMQRILTACPAQLVVEDSGAAVSVPQNIPEPGPATEPVRYRNCDDVRAAEAAPIRLGDPGYSRRLDRDGDGTGCE